MTDTGRRHEEEVSRMRMDHALAMARRLLAEHGLDGWTVVADRAKTRAGVCRFAKRQIGLSRPLTELHSEEEVRDTVLHEIAHALVGPEHGHDRVWRAKARAIGSSGERCVSIGSPRVTGDWVGTCQAGHTHSRHRAPTRVVTCSRCARRFDLRHLIRWTYRGASVPMPERYAAELRQLLGSPAETVVRGVPARSFRVGDLVEIHAPASMWHGAVGEVELVGATKCQVRIDGDPDDLQLGEQLVAAPLTVLRLLGRHDLGA